MKQTYMGINSKRGASGKELIDQKGYGPRRLESRVEGRSSKAVHLELSVEERLEQSCESI